MPNRGPQRQQIIGWGFLYLLLSQEAFAARVIASRVHGSPGPPGDAEEHDGGSALMRLEKLHDLVVSETQRWMTAKGLEDEVPVAEGATPASLAELYGHLDENMLGTLKEQAGDVKGLLREAEKELLQAADENGVENLSVFLCKRSEIEGYRYADGNWFWQREISSSAHMRVRCSQKVALVMNGELAASEGEGDRESVLQRKIENLKGLTRRRGDSEFTIGLKVCASGDCSQSGDESQAIRLEGLNSASALFGDALTNEIPVPASIVDDLPSPSQNPTDLYSICFDDQDECGGMMWVPKNMHSCNGWFGAKDARLTLAHLRDAIGGGFFGRAFSPDASQRAREEMEIQKDVADVMHADSTPGVQSPLNEADLETIDRVHSVPRTASCPLEEYRAAEEAEAQEMYGDLLEQVTQSANLARDASLAARALLRSVAPPPPRRRARSHRRSHRRSKSRRHVPEPEARPDPEAVAAAERDAAELQAESRLRLESAGDVCHEVRESGDNDCSSLRDRTLCERLVRLCGSVGADIQVVRDSEEECQDPTTQLAPQRARDEDQASLVERDSAQLYHRRRGWAGAQRRRRSSLMMSLLFPPVYYGYRPYCYSWHRYSYYHYAYPIVPNVGGYSFGFGTFHPGLMVIEAVGRVIYHSLRAIAWVGARLFEGTVSVATSAARSAGHCDSDDGACGVVALVTVAIILVTLMFTYCMSSEERCQGPRHSRFFRHSRMARQGRRWANTWEAIESRVYDDTGGHLIFDSNIDTGSRCMTALQYGRRWVRKSDVTWFAATANVTSAANVNA